MTGGPRREAFARVIVPAMAAAGLIAAHLLAYGSVYGEHAHRRAVLAATGHGYLSWASFAAVVALAVAVATTAGLASRPTARHPVPRARATFGRLATAQAVAFVVLESAERVAAGGAVTPPLRLLLIGLALQFVVAFAGTVLLACARRVGEVLATVRHRRSRQSTAARSCFADEHHAGRVASCARAIRAPPALSTR